MKVERLRPQTSLRVGRGRFGLAPADRQFVESHGGSPRLAAQRQERDPHGPANGLEHMKRIWRRLGRWMEASAGPHLLTLPIRSDAARLEWRVGVSIHHAALRLRATSDNRPSCVG